MRRIALFGSIAAVIIGGFVAIALGNGSQSTIKSSHRGVIKERRVASPSGDQAVPLAKRRLHRARVTYFETSTFKLGSGKTDGSSGRCPRHSKAINGYFGSNTNQVAAIHDSVGNSLRVWETFIHNFGPTDARVFVGTVCLKP
jgi:hypothetical protein